MATWQFLRIDFCASPMLRPITIKVISYRSTFLPIISSMARVCPAAIEFTFKAKPDGATHRAFASARRSSFNLFPPEWIRTASGLFQNFATALLKRANAQTLIAALP
jgi:hypothetical protein